MIRKILAILTFLFTYNANAQLNTQNLIYKGRLELYKKNYIEALNIFNNLIKIKPGLVEPYFYRGMVKYQLKDLVGAEKDFDKTITMNPFYVSAYHYLAVVKTELQDYNLALKNIDKAIKLAPFDPKLYLTKGVIFLQLKKYSNAKKNFFQAKKLNPQMPETYINLGILFASKKKLDSAIAFFNKAIRLNNFYDEAYARRALTYFDKNKIDSAINDINTAIKLNKNNALYYYWRANIFYKKPNFDKSLKDFAKVIELSPNNATAYYNKAIIESEIGLYNAAIADYKQVSNLSPKNILPLYNKALIHYKLKEYNQAINDLIKVLEIYDEFAPAYKLRAEIYNTLGDEKRAFVDAQKYQKLIQGNYESKIDTNYLYKIISFDDDFFSSDTTKSVQIPYSTIKIKILKQKTSDEPFFNKYTYTKLDKLPLKNYHLCFLSLDGNTLTNKELSDLDASLNKSSNQINNILKSIILLQENNNHKALLQLKLINNKKYNYLKNFLKAQAYLQSQTMLINNKNSGELLDSAITAYSNIKSKDPVIYYNIGNIYLRKKEYYTAIFYYNKAIKQERDFSPAYYNKAFSYLYLNNNHKACQNFSISGEKGINESYELIKKYCQKK